jgi:hypothetical protein
MSSDRQELIRQFAVAIAGAHPTRAFRAHDVALEEIWRISTSLADREPPQPQPQPQPADDRIERALQVLREAVQHPGNADGWSEGWEMVQQAIQILESTP